MGVALRAMDPEKAMAMGALSRGSARPPTLMGFGDDPGKLVLIADAAEEGTSSRRLLAEEAIPDDFVKEAGHSLAQDRRPNPHRYIQAHHRTVPHALGYGATVINGSYPDPLPNPGVPNGFTAGVTGQPRSVCRNSSGAPRTKKFESTWINEQFDNSDVMVPVVSAATGLLYCASKRDGDYEYVGLDWETGDIEQDLAVPRRQPGLERLRGHHYHPR